MKVIKFKCDTCNKSGEEFLEGDARPRAYSGWAFISVGESPCKQLCPECQVPEWRKYADSLKDDFVHGSWAMSDLQSVVALAVHPSQVGGLARILRIAENVAGIRVTDHRNGGGAGDSIESQMIHLIQPIYRPAIDWELIALRAAFLLAEKVTGK